MMKKGKRFTNLGVILVIIALCASYLSVASYAADKPTIYLAGDSTVQTYSSSQAPQQGWGQRIKEFFTTDVIFVNKAIGGRSSKSFIDEGRLKEILSVIKPGDYLFCQWGINDRYKSDPARYTDPNTTFRTYLKMYIDGAKEKGATPVILTPTPRFDYVNGVFQNDFKDYCTAAKEVAAETNTKFIDLQSKALNYLNTIGYDNAKNLYMPNDVLHFNDKGAYQMARLVSEGVKELNIPISKYVLGAFVPSATPTHTPTPLRPTMSPTNTNTPAPTYTRVPTPTPLPALPEDLTGDGVVNMADIMIIAASFNSAVTENNRKCDLNKDNFVNMSDIMLAASKFNTIAPLSPSIYQSEDAAFSLGVLESINEGYTGSGYINYNNVVGSYIEWTVNVPAAGTYYLNFIYANGTTVNRPMEIKVNNNVVSASMDFNSTGTWTTWSRTGIQSSLITGNNTIRATATTANGGPNVDYLEISR